MMTSFALVAVFACLAPVWCWDVSGVEKGLFTFPQEVQDPSSSFVFKIGPKSVVPEDRSQFSVETISNMANNLPLTCFFPKDKPKSPHDSQTLMEQRIQQAMKIANEIPCMKTKGEDHIEVELCSGKTLKKLIPNMPHVVLAPNTAKPPELLTPTDGSVLLTMEYSNKFGKAATVTYRCVTGEDDERKLPNNARAHIGVLKQQREDSWVLEVHHRDPALCSVTASASQLIAPLKGSCYTLHLGWWDYQLCVNGVVRQYHVDEKGTITVENNLGTYAPASGDVLVASALGRPAAVSQLYKQGSFCDLTQAPRRTLVRYECSPEGNTHLKEIREVSTCSYEAIIQTPTVCEHPALKPAEVRHAVQPIDVMCTLDPVEQQ